MTEAQSRILSNMIAKPDIFTGERKEENALLWLKQVDRIRVGLELVDSAILIIVGNHLRGRAEVWWSTPFTFSPCIEHESNNDASMNSAWFNETLMVARFYFVLTFVSLLLNCTGVGLSIGYSMCLSVITQFVRHYCLKYER
ncbi:hypothetical protein BDF20DRAFT_839280 [Mycotypha africana]|uniref:uncharacterized protein n=1 Tax=Mycotypha africana TaxID=64632 RepID=UPI0023015609|nr:uncharacterized protein BDF20DRAFT_839280 [Mycotypha africana]KAI8969354.1 hypothetical protein BDF20DRAFT_839280 [Mycotypha africana]